MATLKVNTLSGIGTEGTVFDGGLKFRSKNYLTLPKGTTAERTATSSGISTVIGASLAASGGLPPNGCPPRTL